MKILNNITLINVNCVDPVTSVKAIDFSSKLLKFNKCILFSHEMPKNINNNIIFQKIDKIHSIKDYNKFILKDAIDYIDTDFCLVIQNDGFVINPHLWDDDFLNYDYIGAPWNQHGMRVWGRTNRIGNGGFSLRSKKLMSFIKDIDINNFYEAEDVFVSKIIEKCNFKYPNIEIACKFSLECPMEDHPFDLRNSFGFHGKHLYDRLIQLCPNVSQIKNL